MLKSGAISIGSKGTFDNPEQAKPQGARHCTLHGWCQHQGACSRRRNFKAEGEVRVSGAQIGGQIACVNSKIRGGLIAQATTAAGALFWTKILQNLGDTKLTIVTLMWMRLLMTRQSWARWRKNSESTASFTNGFRGSDTPKSLARARLDCAIPTKGIRSSQP